MNRKEIISILAILKTAYPRFYLNMSKEDAEQTINLWQEMFKDTNIQILSIAIKSLISHFKYPPTIADIREEIAKHMIKDTDTTDLWIKAYDMLRNGIYMTQEQFETYPEECQKFFGNRILLKKMSSDENINLDVVRSNFYKQIETYKIRKKQEQLIPNQLKQLIQNTANKLTLGD